MEKIISIVLYLIILLIILEELFSLSKLLFIYNTNYNYGKMLRKICNNEHYEYETGRFQLSINQNNLMINNDEKNKYNYMILLLIISIIFTIIISLIYISLVYKNLGNVENIESLNILQKLYIFIILIICILIIILPILFINYLLKNKEKRRTYGPFNAYGDKKYYLPYIIVISLLIILRIFNNFGIISIKDNKRINLYIFIFYSLIYLSVLYYITNLIYIYNNYKDNIYDIYIKPDEKYLDNKYNNDKNIETIDIENEIFYNYLKKICGIQEHNNYINNSYQNIESLPEYSKNKKKKYDSNLKRKFEKTGDNKYTLDSKYITEITDYIKKVYVDDNLNITTDVIFYCIDLYIYDTYSENLIYDKIKSANGYNKIIEHIKTKYDSINDRVIILIADKIRNVINNLAENMLLNNNIEKNNMEIIDNNIISDNKNIKKETIFRKNISGLVLIFFIFILLIIIANIIQKKYYGNIELYKFIRNCVIVPFFSILVMLFIINSTIEYNTLINKYIIYYPNKLYKNDINYLYKIFHPILERESNIYNYKNSVCDGVANGVYQVLYNNILNCNLILNNINLIVLDSKPIYGIGDEHNCNISNGKNYLEDNEYNISYYITNNGKHNIFYDKNNCNKLDYVNVKNIILNLILYDIDNIELTNIIRAIYININEFKKFERVEEYSNYIENNIIKKDNKMLNNIRELLKKIINNSILENLENSVKTLLYSNDKIIKLKRQIENGNLIKIIKYDNIVNMAVDEYINLLIYNLYLLSPVINTLLNEKNICKTKEILGDENNEICNKNKNNKNYMKILISKLDSSDSDNYREIISIELKKELIIYINSINKGINEINDNINKNISNVSLLDNDNIITKYIINNYNNINNVSINSISGYNINVDIDIQYKMELEEILDDLKNIVVKNNELIDIDKKIIVIKSTYDDENKSDKRNEFNNKRKEYKITEINYIIRNLINKYENKDEKFKKYLESIVIINSTDSNYSNFIDGTSVKNIDDIFTKIIIFDLKKILNNIETIETHISKIKLLEKIIRDDYNKSLNIENNYELNKVKSEKIKINAEETNKTFMLLVISYIITIISIKYII